MERNQFPPVTLKQLLAGIPNAGVTPIRRGESQGHDRGAELAHKRMENKLSPEARHFTFYCPVCQEDRVFWNGKICSGCRTGVQ